MLAALRSAAVLGIDAYEVLVEADVAPGLPQWTIVGLPTGAVKESRQRVSSALVNAGFGAPSRRITINLSPADVPKSGTAFDLPIALGILAAIGVVPAAVLRDVVAVGELGLDGSIRGIRGALPVARRAARCGGTLVLPASNLGEAGLARGARLCAPASLGELVEWLRAGALPEAFAPHPAPTPPADVDFADVAGQEQAKRALEIAAAGSHACLLIGPPGAGKTMLARRLPTILPLMEEDEALEVTAIHSVAGLPGTNSLMATRPFRAPHHSVSIAGLIGGGGIPRPGEVSLAHNGVLFLDELLEFPRNALEALRQPVEDGRVVIARASASVSFPARFTLVGATNPCPCGHAGDPRRACSCAEMEVQRYRSRLSGPLADRIDMHLVLTPVPLDTLAGRGAVEGSAEVRARVEVARRAQQRRAGSTPGARWNAHLPARWLQQNGRFARSAHALLARAAERLHLSARAYHRVLRVSRTIADLGGSAVVEEAHVAEALRFRPQLGARPTTGLPAAV